MGTCLLKKGEIVVTDNFVRYYIYWSWAYQSESSDIVVFWPSGRMYAQVYPLHPSTEKANT